MGYVLPWGNMSFWGAQVIVNLFGTMPGIGPGAGAVDPRRLRHRRCDAQPLLRAARGGACRSRCCCWWCCTWWRCAQTGSNNPDGIEIKEKLGPDGQPLDGIPFHPYYTVKDFVGVGVFFVRVRASSCSSCRRSAACSSRRRTSSRPIRCPRPPDIHAGVVLHALLRDPARRAGQGAGGAADGAGAGVVPVPAVARPLAGEVDALQGLDVAHGARPVRRDLPSSCSATSACSRRRACTWCWRASSRSAISPFFWLMPIYTPHRAGEAGA